MKRIFMVNERGRQRELGRADVPRMLAQTGIDDRAQWDRAVDRDYLDRLRQKERELDRDIATLATFSREWWALIKKLDDLVTEILVVRRRLKS